jgi:hypothetical protein
VSFVVRKTTLELERVILTTLFLPVQKTPIVGTARRGICSMLFLWMFQCFPHLRKPTITTSDIHFFSIKLTQGKAINFEDLEFIIDHSKNLIPSPEGDDYRAIVGGHHDYTTVGGIPGASDHTRDAAADSYTNTSPCAADSLPGGTMMHPAGRHRTRSHAAMG